MEFMISRCRFHGFDRSGGILTTRRKSSRFSAGFSSHPRKCAGSIPGCKATSWACLSCVALSVALCAALLTAVTHPFPLHPGHGPGGKRLTAPGRPTIGGAACCRPVPSVRTPEEGTVAPRGLTSPAPRAPITVRLIGVLLRTRLLPPNACLINDTFLERAGIGRPAGNYPGFGQSPSPQGRPGRDRSRDRPAGVSHNSVQAEIGPLAPTPTCRGFRTDGREDEPRRCCRAHHPRRAEELGKDRATPSPMSRISQINQRRNRPRRLTRRCRIPSAIPGHPGHSPSAS